VDADKAYAVIQLLDRHKRPIQRGAEKAHRDQIAAMSASDRASHKAGDIAGIHLDAVLSCVVIAKNGTMSAPPKCGIRLVGDAQITPEKAQRAASRC